MNLKVPGAILPLGGAILSTRAKTIRGVGTTPIWRTRVKKSRSEYFLIDHFTAETLSIQFLMLSSKPIMYYLQRVN